MIIIDCPNCDGEGVARYCTHFDRDGNECGYSDTCPTCQGTGEVEEETFPVECDDDEFFPDMETLVAAAEHYADCISDR